MSITTKKQIAALQLAIYVMQSFDYSGEWAKEIRTLKQMLLDVKKLKGEK